MEHRINTTADASRGSLTPPFLTTEKRPSCSTSLNPRADEVKAQRRPWRVMLSTQELAFSNTTRQDTSSILYKH